MNIENVGSRGLTPSLASDWRGNWTIPAALQLRTQNMAELPRLSDMLTDWFRRRAAVDVPSPSTDPVLNDDKLAYQAIDGELFGASGPSEADITQGGLGDCFFLASLAAVVADDPRAVQEAIRSNADGTYSVRFHKDDGKAVWITVDGDLPVDQKGNLAYASGANSDGDDKLELWVPIMEKAYASFKDQYGRDDGIDGYKDLDRGGSASAAMLALTGKSARYVSTPSSDSALEGLLFAANDGAKVVVSTKRDANEGWVQRHAYTVLGTYEKEGQMMVRLRNPWGSTEPDEALADGQDDGVFDVALDDLKDQIKGVHTDAPEKPRLSILEMFSRLLS